MTCIVGLVDNGTIYLGGDSAATDNWDILLTAYPKVFKRGEFVFGYTGSFRMGQLLQYEFEIPAQNPTQDDYAYMVTVFTEGVRQLFADKGFLWVEGERENGMPFLVGYRGNLYAVYGDFAVMTYQQNYAALGCGADYAMGTFYANKNLPPEKRVKQALKASAHFSNGVSGPFVIIRSN